MNKYQAIQIMKGSIELFEGIARQIKSCKGYDDYHATIIDFEMFNDNFTVFISRETLLELVEDEIANKKIMLEKMEHEGEE